MEKNYRPIKSFVKRCSRISGYQKNAILNLSDKYVIDKENFKLDVFDRYGVIIEIGFGMGDATYKIALNQRDKFFLCFEVHTPGVGRLINLAEENSIDNLRVVIDDAKRWIKDFNLERKVCGYHIFFPDPWNKNRHKKRRLLDFDFLNCLIKSLKKDGYIFFVTDCKDYAESVISILENFKELKDYSNKNYERIEWRPLTKFEKKAYEQSVKVYDIFFKKEDV